MSQPPKDVKDMKTHEIARAQTGDISARVQERELRVIQKDEEVIRSLLNEKDPPSREYPEAEFRKNFLPVITGEAYEKLPEGYTAQRLNDEVHRCWVLIAGSTNDEVAIIEPDGTTAFIFPALADTSVLKINQPEDDPGLRHLQKEVIERAQGLPHVANRQMVQGLERKIAYMTSNSRGDEHTALKRISAMRKYYGLDAAEETQSKAKENQDFMGEMDFD